MNVWVLLNDNAGRSLPSDELHSLIERAGHAVVGVAKQYHERTELPSGIDVIVAAGGDGTVAAAAAIASAPPCVEIDASRAAVTMSSSR